MMFWRIAIDQLFEPAVSDERGAVSHRDVLDALRNFTNPLWQARAPATPASAGARGDQHADMQDTGEADHA
jgi:hypothetical protein